MTCHSQLHAVPVNMFRLKVDFLEIKNVITTVCRKYTRKVWSLRLQLHGKLIMTGIPIYIVITVSVNNVNDNIIFILKIYNWPRK